ncbi:dual specificity protein phosphatase family protein [Spirillospora sp. NPDC029432]|uniref:fused DSP-PTPase phosphatase/NAD kinase-like protein n=1 Tax=Spirillospora sp. NPDC029432 TaxID=3154599 RepID=UPI003453AF1A
MRPTRIVAWFLAGGIAGYALIWLVVTLVILAMSGAARNAERAAPPRPANPAAVPGIKRFAHVDDRVWRGAAPTAGGYRRLARLGVRTVVDLRAERPAREAARGPRRAGLEVVRLPVRDGQAPTDAQVDRFVSVVERARGPVFVHCGAGVGRTGAMSAAYLVRTGRADASTATLRSLAAGPPTLEQLSFMRRLGRDRAGRPPVLLVALSRVADSPRRSWTRLRE